MTVKPALKLLLGCLVAVYAATPAHAKSRPAANSVPLTDAETVVISTGGTFEKLIVIEARQQLQAEKARRIISFVPAGRLKTPVTLVIAQKGLTDTGQIHTSSSAFVTKLAEFSAPRLAVYDDSNPCVKDAGQKLPDDGAEASQKPTVSVSGVPYMLEDPAAKAEPLFFTGGDIKKHGRGLSFSDQTLLTTLANQGYGLVRVSFSPGKQKDPLLSAAVQIAAETSAQSPKIQIISGKEFLVERFFLGPETIEALPGTPLAHFPTGVELPHETAQVWGQAYNDWVASAIKSASAIRRFVGPVNRCDLCYDQPPGRETLQAAGAFWMTTAAPVRQGSLRSKPSGPEATFDTWLSRHLIKKPAKAALLLISEISQASVGARFLEQGSVQRPFLGEIFCPAMTGYQKSLAERREKTIAALNGLSGWTEKDLKEAFANVGGANPTWYQDHFNSGK